MNMDIGQIGFLLMVSGSLIPYTSFYETFKLGVTRYSTHAFFWVNKQIAKLKIKYTHLYNENSSVRFISDWTASKYKSVEHLFTNKKYEPDFSSWVMTGTLYNSDSSSPTNKNRKSYYFSSRFNDYYSNNRKKNMSGFYLIEKYDSLETYKIAKDKDPDIFKKLMTNSYFNSYSNHCIKSILEIKNNADNTIYNKDNFTVMKYDDNTHIVNICKPSYVIPNELNLQHSDIHFISLQYTH